MGVGGGGKGQRMTNTLGRKEEIRISFGCFSILPFLALPTCSGPLACPLHQPYLDLPNQPSSLPKQNHLCTKQTSGLTTPAPYLPCSSLNPAHMSPWVTSLLRFSVTTPSVVSPRPALFLHRSTYYTSLILYPLPGPWSVSPIRMAATSGQGFVSVSVCVPGPIPRRKQRASATC